MWKLLTMVLVAGLIAMAIRQFDMFGEGGGKTGSALRSGVHSLTGKTTADLGRETMSFASRARIARAVREYVSESGELPRDLDELVDRGFIQEGAALDEWGRALSLEATEAGILLRSAGPDADFHTDDDWTLNL